MATKEITPTGLTAAPVSSEVARMEELVRRRGGCRRRLTLIKKGMASWDVTDQGLIEFKIADTLRIYRELESYHEAIVDPDEAALCKYEEEATELFDSIMWPARKLLIRFAKENTPTASTSDVRVQESASNEHVRANTMAQLKLPVFTLPEFDGTMSNWSEFKAQFESIIGSVQNMDDVTKLHYLKASLKGAASQIIAKIASSAENYSRAWDVLLQRFDNKRREIRGNIDGLLDLPRATHEGDAKLREIADNAMAYVQTLEGLGLEMNNTSDALITTIVINKLDAVTAMEWERTLPREKLPTFKELHEFISSRCSAMESSRPMQRAQGTRCNASTNTQCVKCNKAHRLHECESFKSMENWQRFGFVKRLGLCFKCLAGKHSVRECTFRNNCAECGKEHNTLVHLSESRTNVQASSAFTGMDKGWLATAVVKLVDARGTVVKCRAMLDSGAQSCFITERIASRFAVLPRDISCAVSGIGDSEVRSSKLIASTIQSRGGGVIQRVNFVVLKKLSNDLPEANTRYSSGIPRKLFMADPKYNISGSVDCILGANVFWDLLQVGKIKCKDGTILHKTALGWIVCASEQSTGIENGSSSSFKASCCIEDAVPKFWEMEEVVPPRHYSENDDRVLEFFNRTTKRSNTGRFKVQLPLKENRRWEDLGNSRVRAHQRLVQLERRFEKSEELKKEYATFMREYELLGHMVRVPSTSDETGCFYLPHHAVLKADSLTTKLRVVFDASAKTTSDVSLNDILEVGPAIQDDLFDIIVRFRSHNIVLVADIEKMYRQVEIEKEHENKQRILWRENVNDPPAAYALRTLTYGTAPAAFLSIRCLHQLAEEDGKKYRLAASVLKRDFYVDDVLTGASNEEKAIELRDELFALLAAGGFTLKKWISNKPAVLQDLPQSNNFVLTLNEGLDSTVKTLGLCWNALDDTYSYKAPTFHQGRYTKRSILADVAKLFDPLGLLAPVTIVAKCLIQKMWALKLGWDDGAPLDIHSEWSEFKRTLPVIEKLKIPRKVFNREHLDDVTIHGFCDASESAYAACIYILDKQSGTNRLVCSKTKVAPLKSVSIPRLELCAAVLLVKLLNKVIQALQCSFNNVYCWSDSMITLAWIAGDSKRWNVFVANRVSEIQRNGKTFEWLHVPSESNPADLASRGIKPHDLMDNWLWWHGPMWLSDRAGWPSMQVLESNVTEELKRTAVVLRADVNDKRIGEFIKKFSSLTRLVRVFAWVKRFVNNLVRKTTRISDKQLGLRELDYAEDELTLGVQKEEFADLMKVLHLGKSDCKAKGTLQALNPFLDESRGIICVGGRLANSGLSIKGKFPALLPKMHPFTNLVIERQHKRHLHAGTSLTLSAVRQRYWPINGREVVARLIRGCISCVKHQPVLQNPLMGALPSVRVHASRPFLNVGVDFCGPFMIKEGNRRTLRHRKAYGCVFICMATKAVHLELVSDLTTDAFLATLDRFIGRRGAPVAMYSDNGTNFVGAARELCKMVKKVQNDELGTWTANHGVTWHFIPPRAPHFGGLWEAAVKSMKKHLARVVGETKLTFEELTTLLARIEAILNSRPLTMLSNDANDVSPLTPGHFLIGECMTAVPEGDCTDVPINRLSRWQHIQYMRQHFWKRWTREYLHTLQQRPRQRQQSTSQLKPGDVVIVKEDAAPLHWPMGRVVEATPGADGIVRVVKVKTVKGEYVRATKYLCKLPVGSE